MDLRDLRKQLLRVKPDRKRASDEAMQLTDMLPNIDDQIAKYYLGLRKDVVNSMKADKVLIATSESSGKTLVAKYGVKEHQANVTSLDRCLAGCSLYVLKQLNSEEPDTFMELNGLHNGIRNSLADAYRIRPDSNLYYVFTTGLENLIEDCPVLVTAMLYWRLHNRDAIFKTKATEETLIQESRKSAIHYARICRRDNISPERLFDKLEEKMIDSGLISHLEGLEPYVKRVQKQNSCEWLTSLLEPLISFFQPKQSRVAQNNPITHSRRPRETRQVRANRGGRRNLPSSRLAARLNN